MDRNTKMRMKKLGESDKISESNDKNPLVFG